MMKSNFALQLTVGLVVGSAVMGSPDVRAESIPTLEEIPGSEISAAGLQVAQGSTAVMTQADQIRELETELEAAQQRGDQSEIDRIQAELRVLRDSGLPTFYLQQVTVTGTRTPRSVADSPATITIIDQEQLRQNLSQNIQDLVRYEPGVSVREDPRFGFQDFNIRGLDGNRVLIQVDGIRQPERFVFGQFTLGRDYFETETLRTLEIIRGPGSSLYGSDALGGVVTFTTLDPEDLLRGEDLRVTLSSQFNSVNQGYTNTLGLAGREGDVEAMLLYTHRGFRESNGLGDDRFQDTQQGIGDNVLAKVIYRFNDFHSLRLTGEYFNRRVDTTIAPGNLASAVSFFQETVDTERYRVSLEYRYENPENPAFELASAQIYFQPARTLEPSVDNRTVMVRGEATAVQDNTVNELISDILGVDIRFQSRFQTGAISHRLVYGADVSTTRNERLRDRVRTNLATGEGTRDIPPNNFPVRDFPDSDTLRLGLYLQDEIEFSQGSLTLIPGIRYDIYSLTTDPNEDFLKTGAEAADLSADSISPKLGLVWNATPNLTFTAQYAAGFRAPQYIEINNGFTNLTSPFFRYRTLSNPDLRPETSQSFEVGMRGVYPQAGFSLTGYYNSYNDFIETFRPAGTEPSPLDSGIPGGPPPPPVNLFQSQNVSRARIYGIEATGQYFFRPDLTGFSLNGAFSWSVGDNLTEDKPLISIEPMTAVVGLHYDDPSAVWGARLMATLVADPRDPQREIEEPPTPNATPQIPFLSSGYTTIDLLGYYNLDEEWQITFGVFNLFDERYYLYNETRNLFQQPDNERFLQPGRNVAINFSTRF
ncbi:MAG: TonB-dependent hemoglobin/transferrin/lactoferrin family receptor [Cyanophyceae cyanobacterium]